MDTFLEQGSLARNSGDPQIFTAIPVDLEQGRSQRRLTRLVAASGSVLAAFQGGEVARWFPDENEFTLIHFGKDRVGEISKVLLDPTGFHALMTNSSGDTWYLNYQSTQPVRLPKLKGQVLESASWDVEATWTSTRDLLLGTRSGQILQVVIESKDASRAAQEKSIKTLCEFERAAPVLGIHRERVYSTADGLERLVLFAAAGCSLYAFVGANLESLFQRYQGERVTSRARIYEVPFDSPYGDLQIDEACVGPPGTKVLFWLTGVGVLAAKVQSTIDEDAVQMTSAVLESPPGLVPFPSKAAAANGGVVSPFLPAPPPPAPRSMALTRYHIIFVFEDRWIAVSRITHEVIQQQDWAMSTYGPLRGVARDLYGEKLWLCSERHAFGLHTEKEDRNVWALLLRLEQFDDALSACKRPSQRMRVLATHADCLFRKPGMEIQAARKFAESTVPFEHVALRFLGGKKAGLLEYLRCRLKNADDQVTRSLLSVWAVEISLARLNELRQAEDLETLALERQQLSELLRECTELDVHATIYHLLQSHGWLDELAMFAEMRKDFTTVILHHVSRRDCGSAIRKLNGFGGGLELVCRFAPVLFGAEPNAFASLLLRPQLSTVDPLLVLPGVYSPHSSQTHRAEAMRYLEHALRHTPELHQSGGDLEIRASSFRTGGSLLLDNLASVGDETGHAMQQSGWASGTAILNAMVVLLATDCTQNAGGDTGPEDAEAALLRFLEAQEANPLLDPHFALRICRQKGLIKAMVLLYGLMQMHEEAVEVALKHEDIALAKRSACKPPDTKKRLRQKLWLRIVEHQAATSDVQKIIGLIRESQELTVRDVLPYLSDSMTIDAFKDEICECLDKYEGQIVTLRQEMDDHRRALSAFKEDLKKAEERCIVVAADQCCEICGADAMTERFYAFTCTHCCHEACLRALILPTLSEKCREHLFKLEEARLQHQAAAAGAAAKPGSPLAEVEDELDGILAEDCPFCGQLMIDTIMKPFIDPNEAGEAEEIESWAI